MNDNPYESLSHGLMVSKLWLCEELEKTLFERYVAKVNVAVLGSWTNIIGLLMVTRNPRLYNKIYGYDIDKEAIMCADKICDTWKFIEPNIYNIVLDANDVDFAYIDVVINCSVEHMKESKWYDNIPEGTLVCLQSSNVDPNQHDWNIVNPNNSLQGLKQKYPLARVMYEGIKEIRYSHWGYDRYMVIGYK